MLDRAYTTELVEEKETPATKHSRPQKRRPNNRQVVEDMYTSEDLPRLLRQNVTREKGRRKKRMGEPVTPLTGYLVILFFKFKMDAQDLILEIQRLGKILVW